MNQVQELENAIIARAEHLADEYRQRAERSRDNILKEASEKLHLREEREVLLAKADADRTYRHKVQSSELYLHKEMDLLRWNLVQGIHEQLFDQVKNLLDDEKNYLPLLGAYLKTGAVQIGKDDLVAEFNSRDLQRLQPMWSNFLVEFGIDKEIDLCSTPLDSVGGVLVRDRNNRVRLDNTFEGRMERLDSILFQTIIERLLPGNTGIIST